MQPEVTLVTGGDVGATKFTFRRDFLTQVHDLVQLSLSTEAGESRDIKILFIYMQGRAIERERERGLPTAGLLSEGLQQLGLGRAKAKSPELHLDLPHGWHRPRV